MQKPRLLEEMTRRDMAGEASASSAIAKSAVLVSAITALSVVAEFAKDAVIASKLGVTARGDSFFVALTVPLLLIGALFQSFQISFVPLISAATVRDGASEGRRLANLLITLAVPLLIVVMVLGIAGSDWLAGIAGAGLGLEEKRIAGDLGRVLFPSVLLAGITGITMNWLNSQRYFGAPASINLVRSAATVAIILVGWSTLGMYSVALGFLVGSALQLAVVGSVAAVRGFKFKPTLATTATELTRIAALVAWPLAIILFRQASTIFERMFASYLEAGSISSLNYAFRITFGVTAIFSTSVFAVLLPTLSSDVAALDVARMRKNLTAGLKLVLLFVLPIMIGILVLNRSIIGILFQRGAFDRSATETTSTILSYYILSLLLRATIPILQAPLFALGDVRTPVLIAAGAAMVQIASNALLVGPLGVAGLVAGDTIARGCEIGATYILLRRRIGQPLDKNIGLFLGKVLLATLGMGIIVLLLRTGLERYLGDGFLYQLMILGSGVVVGAGAFTALMITMGVSEFGLVTEWALARLGIRSAGSS